MPLESAIYRGTVQHRRHAPKPHRFQYRTWFAYLDLDEIDHLVRQSAFFSRERINLASFRRRDYFGSVEDDLKNAVLQHVKRELGIEVRGPVRMLAHLACLGFCFNPVSFYYVYDRQDLAAIVAEITNTPWGERHAYAFAVEPGSDAAFDFRKQFHVSPFLDMDLDYQWRFSRPGNRLNVSMIVNRGPTRMFDAALGLKRLPFDASTLRGQLLHQPLITIKTVAAIYWQATRLWLKKTPFYSHPAKRGDIAAGKTGTKA